MYLLEGERLLSREDEENAGAEQMKLGVPP